MSSICCKAETRIGYYNIDQRPDIHGIVETGGNAYAVMGTYCNKCGKLCDFKQGRKEFYTNGVLKKKK